MNPKRCLHDHELARLLAEDAPYGDLTTDALGIGRGQGRAVFRARHAATVCAVEEAARLFELAGAVPSILCPSGSRVEPGTALLEVVGSVAALHRTYKSAQVLMEWASGIATAAAAIVAAAGGVPVACTRKNVPGTRALSAKAVCAGGARLHRLGLSETLLVFDEHRRFLDEDPATTVRRLKAAEPEKKVVVEVADIDEALRWAQADADVLQLEKFAPQRVAACRRLVDAARPGVKLAATGGVDASNARAYADAGADLIVSSAPYWAPPRDVKVVFALLDGACADTPSATPESPSTLVSGGPDHGNA
ncbi:ModD protein [Thauera sp.]